MALKDTCKAIKTLLEHIAKDIDKAEAGNKAAAQRVRTATIRLEKVAKVYRKESVVAAKSGELKRIKVSLKKKKTAKPAKAKVTKAKVAKAKPAKKAKHKAVKHHAAKKVVAKKKKSVKPHSLSRKSPAKKAVKHSKKK